jgi:hypothetical protein
VHEPSILTAPVLLTAVAFLATMLAMYALVLRFGPRRGNWGSPAAAFRAPGRATTTGLLVLAALHALAGVVLAIALPGGNVGVLLVGLAAGALYAAMSQATRIARHAPKPPADRGAARS